MRSMSTRTRWIAALGLVIVSAALLPVALRSPRLTLLNAALRIDYGWAAGAAALGAAVLLAAASAAAPRRWAQAVLVLFAVAVGGLGGARLRYRLEIQPDGLRSRELMGSTLVPWGEVTHVDRGTEALVVWGLGEAQIRVDTASFEGDQRAALERALARRIIESTKASAQ
jgi:hypothetical protein